MATTPLVLTESGGSGLTVFPTPVAADVNGNTFPNDGHTWLYIDAGAAGGTLTVRSNLSLPTGITVPDKVHTLAASTIYLLDPAEFVLSLTGSTVTVTASVATIKLRAFH